MTEIDYWLWRVYIETLSEFKKRKKIPARLLWLLLIRTTHSFQEGVKDGASV